MASAILRRNAAQSKKYFPATHSETRWASKFFVMQNMLPLRNDINSAFNELDPCLKDENVSQKIRTDEFWDYLSRTLELLRPLSIIITNLESETETLGNVYDVYHTLLAKWTELSLEQGANGCIRSAIRMLVSRRGHFDCDESLAANLLHPILRGSKLTPQEKKRACAWIVDWTDKEKQGDVISSLTDYHLGTSDYNDEYCRCSAKILTPVTWWKSIKSMVPHCAIELVEVAMRLGSIPATSAASERVWSSLGNIHTKKRNRLGNEKIEKLGIVYCTIKASLKSTKKQRVECLEHVDEGTDGSSAEESGVDSDGSLE